MSCGFYYWHTLRLSQLYRRDKKTTAIVILLTPSHFIQLRFCEIPSLCSSHLWEYFHHKNVICLLCFALKWAFKLTQFFLISTCSRFLFKFWMREFFCISRSWMDKRDSFIVTFIYVRLNYEKYILKSVLENCNLSSIKLTKITYKKNLNPPNSI